MTQEPRKFKVARVLGTAAQDEDESVPPEDIGQRQGTAGRDKAGPAQTDDLPAANRTRGVGRSAKTGIALVACALVMLLLAATLPWFQISGGTLDRSQTRDTVLDAEVGYLASATSLPTWGLTIVALAGFGLILADVAARTDRAKTLADLGAGIAAAYGSFIAWLGSTRALGYWIGEALDAGNARFDPHAAVFLLLAVSPALMIIALRVVRAACPTPSDEDPALMDRRLRLSRFALAGAGFVLLVFPLIPVASDFNSFDGADHLTEGEIYEAGRTFSFGNAGARDVASDLDAVHAVLWWSIIVSGTTWIATRLRPIIENRRLLDAVGLAFSGNAVLLVFLLVTTIFLYFNHIPSMQLGFFSGDSYAPVFNHLLPLEIVFLGVLSYVFVRRETLPALRRRSKRGAAQPAAPLNADG